MPNEITIQPIPAEIDITNLKVEPNECYTNAYNLAKQNAGVSLVEGILILIDIHNCGKGAAHAWNELDGSHFDITSTLWKEDEHSQIKNLHYFPNVFHKGDELVHPDFFKFDPETANDVREVNAQISSNAGVSKKSNFEQG